MQLTGYYIVQVISSLSSDYFWLKILHWENNEGKQPPVRYFHSVWSKYQTIHTVYTRSREALMQVHQQLELLSSKISYDIVGKFCHYSRTWIWCYHIRFAPNWCPDTLRSVIDASWIWWSRLHIAAEMSVLVNGGMALLCTCSVCMATW